MKANAIFSPVILTFIVLGTGGLNPDRELKRYEFAEPHLGTQIRMIIYADRDPAELASTLFRSVESLNKIYSDYDDNSELMRFCRAEAGQPHAVSPLLFETLEHAQQVAHESKGAFDITVGPLSQLWRRARRQKQLPNEDAIKKALALVGYQKLTLDRKEQTATLQIPGMRLDLGGIAKGHIGDQIMSVLRGRFPHSMMALGGDLVLGQPPPGEAGWKVQIGPADPTTAERLTLSLSNCAVSTSGDAEQFLEVAGKRYSHIIDPRTGWGRTESPLVTVIAKAGWEADALTKPLSLLDVDAGQAIIAKHPGAAARWTLAQPGRTARIVVSPRWRELREAAVK